MPSRKRREREREKDRKGKILEVGMIRKIEGEGGKSKVYFDVIVMLKGDCEFKEENRNERENPNGRSSILYIANMTKLQNALRNLASPAHLAIPS